MVKECFKPHTSFVSLILSELKWCHINWNKDTFNHTKPSSLVENPLKSSKIFI